MKLALSVKGEPYRRVDVATYADACRAWLLFQATANFGEGFGGSAMTRDCGQIYDDQGKPVAYVSYNGRVWAGKPKDWKSGNVPLLERENA